jgi:hypothetical protein
MRANLSKVAALALRFLRESDGAGYSVSVVMALPFYVFFLTFIAEIFCIMVAHMHVETAAYEAARSAAVWDGQPSGDRDENAKHAAVLSLVPVSSGQARHQGPLGQLVTPTVHREAILFAYDSRVAKSRYRRDHLGRKIDYAYWHTSVATDDEGDQEDRLVTATVEFRAPLHFPLAAQVLGQRDLLSGGHYFMYMRSAVTIPSERAATPDGKLGIKYAPR